MTERKTPAYLLESLPTVSASARRAATEAIFLVLSLARLLVSMSRSAICYFLFSMAELSALTAPSTSPTSSMSSKLSKTLERASRMP